MSVSLYDAIVPPYRQIVNSVRGVLKKGAEHYKAEGRSPDDLLPVKLFDDMHPLTFQLHSVAHHSIGAIEGVKAGEFGPPSSLEGLDYAGFQDKLAGVDELLEAINPDDLNACSGKDVIFKIGERELPFTAEGFLFSFSKPNLYFHATTAYDLLRMKGVPLGKQDFLGRLQLNM